MHRLCQSLHMGNCNSNKPVLGQKVNCKFTAPPTTPRAALRKVPYGFFKGLYIYLKKVYRLK